MGEATGDIHPTISLNLLMAGVNMPVSHAEISQQASVNKQDHIRILIINLHVMHVNKYTLLLN